MGYENEEDEPGNRDVQQNDDSNDEEEEQAAEELESGTDPKKAVEEATELHAREKKRELTTRLTQALVSLTREFEEKRRQKTRDQAKKKGQRRAYPYSPIVSHKPMAYRLAQKAYNKSGGKKTSFAERAQVSNLVLATVNKSNTGLPEDAHAVAELLNILKIKERTAATLPPEKFHTLFQQHYNKLKGPKKIEANYYIHYLHSHLDLVPTASQDAFSQL